MDGPLEPVEQRMSGESASPLQLAVPRVLRLANDTDGAATMPGIELIPDLSVDESRVAALRASRWAAHIAICTLPGDEVAVHPRTAKLLHTHLEGRAPYTAPGERRLDLTFKIESMSPAVQQMVGSFALGIQSSLGSDRVSVSHRVMRIPDKLPGL